MYNLHEQISYSPLTLNKSRGSPIYRVPADLTVEHRTQLGFDLKKEGQGVGRSARTRQTAICSARLPVSPFTGRGQRCIPEWRFIETTAVYQTRM